MDQGFISIGWDAIGDLRKIGPTRQDFKDATLAAYPDSKPGAIPVSAGVLFRFRDEMRIRDIVVAPGPHPWPRFIDSAP